MHASSHNIHSKYSPLIVSMKQNKTKPYQIQLTSTPNSDHFVPIFFCSSFFLQYSSSRGPNIALPETTPILQSTYDIIQKPINNQIKNPAKIKSWSKFNHNYKWWLQKLNGKLLWLSLTHYYNQQTNTRTDKQVIKDLMHQYIYIYICLWETE